MGNARDAQSSGASKVHGSMREEIEMAPLCALKALAKDDTDSAAARQSGRLDNRRNRKARKNNTRLRRCLAKDDLMWRGPQEEMDDGREPTNEMGLSIFRPRIGACFSLLSHP